MQETLFSWNDIGDVCFGRPSLGDKVDVRIYRMMQFSLRSVLELRYGQKECRELIKCAGRLAGLSFCNQYVDTRLSPGDFLERLRDQLFEKGIGIFTAEKVDLDSLEFTFTVSEDLDCSGLPVTGEPVCDFDEGFIGGILETYLGKSFEVREVDCWASGSKTCRFDARPGPAVCECR